MKFLIYLFPVSLLLSSCGLFGTYERNQPYVQQLTDSLYRNSMTGVGLLNDTNSLGNLPWTSLFTDPQLQALIAQALRQNTDIRKADLTVKQAEIGLRINKLAYLPAIQFAPSGTIAKTFIDGAESVSTYDLPLQASWQIDAFGTLYNAKKQGELTVQQSKAAQQAAHTAIVASVAQLYYSLQMLDEQARITASTVDIWKKNVQTMQAMKEAGMTHSAAVASAQAQLAQIEGNLNTIGQNIVELEHALCLLLHEPPHPIVRSGQIALTLPSKVSVGLPLHLLANRPDVAIAEAKLAQSFYGIQAARGAFYPKITINAQGKFTNSIGALILNPGKFIAAGVASLAQPLFAQGKLKGNLEMAKLQQETAQLDFERALLMAGQEVSNALYKYDAHQQNAQLAQERLQYLTKASADTEFLFRNGNTTSYLETLTAQMNLLNGQLNLTNHRYEQAKALVSLYKALGGGRSL